MNENIATLLTWDNITLAISVVGFSSGISYFFWASREKPPLESPDSKGENGYPLKTKVHLKDLSRYWLSSGKQKKEKERLYLKDLRHLWRKIDPEIPDNDDTVVDTFKYDRVRKFFHKYIHEKPYFTKARLQRSVIIQILHILDDEGGCPSVVFLKGDPDNSLGITTQGILGRVSLLNHSLNVAEIICRKIKKASPQGTLLMAPDALVCALGHDLGKLPRFNADGYTHGSHPITSNTILSNLKDFKLLKNREEIENAVKRHHHPNLDQEKSPLLRLLGASDKKARKVEEDVVIGLDKERFEKQRFVYLDNEEDDPASVPQLSPETSSAKRVIPSSPVEKEECSGEDADDAGVVDQGALDCDPDNSEDSPQLETEKEEASFDVPAPPLVPKAETPKNKKPARPKNKPAPPPSPSVSGDNIGEAQDSAAAAWKEQNYLHGIEDPTLGLLEEKAKTLSFEGWFDPALFLSDLEKKINQMEELRICAFSMPAGKIYVTRPTMVSLVQKQAKTAKIGWLTDLDVNIDLSGDEDKDQKLPKIWAPILVAVVDQFREQGFIDASIHPGFYGNRFVLTSNPVISTGARFYTVFKANAFKTTIPRLEKKKKAARLLSIKDVHIANGSTE